jgi:hypothetical protein
MTDFTALPPVTNFPIVDFPREGDPFTYPGRTVLDHFGFIEPYQPATDYWCALPVRLVHTEGGGFGIELGPYTLNHTDIDRLRATINSYDEATGPHLRAVE